jgi:Holliday junction DNA helicase RuvA
MYDYIKGTIAAKVNSTKGVFVTVETGGGVGYLTEVTGRDFEAAPEVGVQGKIYTVLIHREDKMSLCGFLHKEDRDIFNILTSVSGVGSKMALMLLNEFTSSELIGFVIGENFKALTRAKGVGPKLAQKIILELKDKLMNYQTKEPIAVSGKVDSQAVQDAQMVLTSLGYEREEIRSALSKAAAAGSVNAEEILREALKALSNN